MSASLQSLLLHSVHASEQFLSILTVLLEIEILESVRNARIFPLPAVNFAAVRLALKEASAQGQVVLPPPPPKCLMSLPGHIYWIMLTERR